MVAPSLHCEDWSFPSVYWSLVKFYSFVLLSYTFLLFFLLDYFSAKVRAFITCKECGKRRVVYSQAKLTTTELRSVTRVEEELVYTCGNPLFYAGQFRDKILVKEGLSCSSEIEAAYYAGIILKKNYWIFFNCTETSITFNNLNSGTWPRDVWKKGYRNITKH